MFFQAKFCSFIKNKKLCYSCFPVNFAKFLNTGFTEDLWATASVVLQ